MTKGIFSFFKKKPDPVEVLKDAINRNPNGLQMVLLSKPSIWSICAVGGDIHLDDLHELNYCGEKPLDEAIHELVQELRTPVSAEDLNVEKSYESRTRKILGTLDAVQQINIGTEEVPVYVTLAYDWGYWSYGVHVYLVKGYSTSRFGGKNDGFISWREMYGFVQSMPPGKNGGSDWFHPRIARDD